MSAKKMLAIAGVLGIVAVALLQVESWRNRGGTVMVFRVTRNVQPPATLQGSYEAVGIPGSAYEAMRSQVPTADLEAWVRSTPVVRPMRAGETVTFDALQKSADQGVKIQQGMRGIGIAVQAAQAVGYLIRPGDFVDVLGTVPGEKSLVTRHLLQAKRVLAIDQQYRLEDSAFLQTRTYSTVTLEVTPAEAEIMEAYRALVKTGFSLSLRAKGDTQSVTTPSYPVSDIGIR